MFALLGKEKTSSPQKVNWLMPLAPPGSPGGACSVSVITSPSRGRDSFSGTTKRTVGSTRHAYLHPCCLPHFSKMFSPPSEVHPSSQSPAAAPHSRERFAAHSTAYQKGIQLLGLRGKALCRSLPKITGEIGFLHRPASVPAFTKPFFLYPQSQYGPPEARVFCRTKSVAPPASLMV